MSSIGLRLAASTSRAARHAAVRAQACRVQSRELHRRKELSYPIEEGLGTFLPPPALKMIAEDYQQGLLDRLNDQVRGTALENKSIVQTVVEGARDPNKVLEFNYASEALNNSFFLESIKPPPANATSHQHALRGTALERRISYNWGSLAHFQSSFNAAALGMFSSGWLWLVTDQDSRLAIVPTFGTGTLLVRSGKPSDAFLEWQRLVGEPVVPYSEGELPPSSSSHSPSSPPPPTSPVSGLSHGAPPLDPHTPARTLSSGPLPVPPRTYGTKSRDNVGDEPNLQNLGQVLHPLLCLSVHEHAWVGAGYGVWGKEEYLKRFWTVVDWEKASTLFNKVTPKAMQ
ncbi:Manganese/iron superoxide dismutase [Trametes polyzona]|nr:Manganese/iron superoxide dismutase [Trametes polyzona]